jgi:hypothetical protein
MTRATTPLSSRAPSVLPQVGQKARLDPLEERHVAGGPPGPVQSTCPGGNSAQHRVSAPECRWHIRQEQVWGDPAGPVARNRMCPHRHPPTYPVTAIRHPPFQCLPVPSKTAPMRGHMPFKCASPDFVTCRPEKFLPSLFAERKVFARWSRIGLSGRSGSLRRRRQQAESDAPRLDL